MSAGQARNSRSGARPAPVSIETAIYVATALYAAALTACAAAVLFFTKRLGLNWTTAYLAVVFVAGLHYSYRTPGVFRSLASFGPHIVRQLLFHAGALFLVVKAVKVMEDHSPAMVAAGAWLAFWAVLSLLKWTLQFLFSSASRGVQYVTRGTAVSKEDAIAEQLGARKRV